MTMRFITHYFAGKNVTSSSIFILFEHSIYLPPIRAVDGVTEFTGDRNRNRFCTNSTAEGDTDKWLMVDLGRSHLIWGVNLAYEPGKLTFSVSPYEKKEKANLFSNNSFSVAL